MPTQVERMPLWLAVAISVVVALPFGLLLKGFNLVLWIAFTVWGVHLAFGGDLQGARRLLPAYAGGAVSGRAGAHVRPAAVLVDHRRRS